MKRWIHGPISCTHTHTHTHTLTRKCTPTDPCYSCRITKCNQRNISLTFKFDSSLVAVDLPPPRNLRTKCSWFHAVFRKILEYRVLPPPPPPFEGWCPSAGNPGSAHTYHMRDVSVPVADMFGHSKNWGAGGKVLILSPFSLVHVVSAKTKIVLGAREETKKILSTDKMLCKIIHMTKIVSFISRQFIPENKPFHIIWPYDLIGHYTIALNLQSKNVKICYCTSTLTKVWQNLIK